MIQVINRALDILEFVAKQGKEPIQLIKIAQNANLSQPTTANIVKTLLAKNYLERVSRKDGYRLGAGAYQLTGNLSYNQNVILAAKEVMEDLTKQLNETSLIGILRNNKRYIIHMVHSDQNLQVRARIESDIYSTATGRLLMAFCTPKELDNIVSVIGLPLAQVWPQALTREALEQALQKIRKEEFAQTHNENHIVGFAVPIYRKKEVIASLSIFLPESRYNLALQEKISKHIRRAAKKIKERLEQEVN